MAMFTLQCPFWFVCFILVLSANNTANPNAIVIVTESLILRICSNTTNPSLCESIFNPFRLRTTLKKPIATLVKRPMDWAEEAARKTHDRVRYLYERTNKQTPKELKERYEQCNGKCLIIKNNIAMTRRPMLQENRNKVRFYIVVALRKAVEVQKKLASPPQEQSDILSEVGFLRDVLDIIVAICDKLPNPS